MNKIDKIKIPKDEVLRYLGYKKQKLNKSIMDVIDEVIKEANNLIEIKYVLSKNKCIIDSKGVIVEGTNLILQGNDIKEHLKKSDEVILLASTVGRAIEKRISYYEKIDLTKAIILDAAATAAIEELCDMIESSIKDDLSDKDKSVNYRFSPGYGDLPLDIQKSFIDAMNAEKTIGLTVSSHNLLMPRKSVTAIMGIVDKENKQEKKGCSVCKNYEKCRFRKEGITCER